MTNPSAPKTSKAIFFLIPILLTVVIGSFHVITGSKIGMKVVRRDSFSFSEFLINVDEITSMPLLAAKFGHPVACSILQREGLIESDAEIQERFKKEAQEQIDDALAKLRNGQKY